MKVKQVSLLYEKHKVFGWRQCTKNSLTEKIFDNLSLVNHKNKHSNLSYLNQLSLVVGSKELGHTSIQEVLSQICEKYVCFDVELKEKVVYVMDHLLLTIVIAFVYKVYKVKFIFLYYCIFLYCIFL